MTAATMALPAVAQPQPFPLPRLPFLPLLALPFMGTDPESIDRIIVAMELLFLVCAVRQPIWVLGALMLSELTVRNYFLNLGGLHISTRLFIALVSALIVLPRLPKAEFGQRGRSMVLIAGLLLGLMTLANAVSSNASYLAQYFRYTLTGFIAFLIIPVVLKSRDDVMRIGIVVLLIGMASTVVALMQHYAFRGAPIIATVPNDVFDTGVEAWGGRALGLAENPIYLTNDLLLLVLPLVGVLLTKAVPEKWRWHIGISAVLMFGALYFTQTRSWIVGAMPALVAMAFLLSPRMRKDVLVLVLVVGVAFWAYSEHTGSRYTLGPSNDDSAATRPVLWNVGLDIAKENPLLGVGHDKFLEISPEYASRVDRTLLRQQNAGDALGRFEPHNDYLNIWLSFGTLALAIYLLMMWCTLSNFRDAFKRLSDPLLRGIALGSLGALIALGINSFFHNFFDSVLTLWILAGLSVALMTLASKDPQPELEQAW